MREDKKAKEEEKYQKEINNRERILKAKDYANKQRQKMASRKSTTQSTMSDMSSTTSGIMKHHQHDPSHHVHFSNKDIVEVIPEEDSSQ